MRNRCPDTDLLLPMTGGMHGAAACPCHICCKLNVFLLNLSGLLCRRRNHGKPLITAAAESTPSCKSTKCGVVEQAAQRMSLMGRQRAACSGAAIALPGKPVFQERIY